MKELPICVLITTYKNVANYRYYYNIKSIIQQEYKNYHLVVIDDASQDQTLLGIKEILVEQDFDKKRYVLIKNRNKTGAMINQSA